MENEIIYDEIRVETCSKQKLVDVYATQSFFDVTKLKEDSINKTIELSCKSKNDASKISDITFKNSIVTYREKEYNNNINETNQSIRICVMELGHNLESVIKMQPGHYKKVVDKVKQDESPIRVYMDGDAWCAVRVNTFVNIQESLCGFGRTPDEAICNLIREENNR